MLDAPDDPNVGEVVLMWASQVTGKTETLNNMVGYTIDIDPCPILNLQPTLEMGETWSKDRLATMLRDTPALRGKVRDARSRDANNTILHKSFRGGHITIAGANSAASLASRPIRKIFFDEIDRYPQSAGTEGDPIALAEKRTESFPDAVKIKTSTPTIRKISKIEKAFEASDKRYWFCPCPHCAHEQTLKWAQVKWITADELTEIWYECENCLKPWTDPERQAAIRAGKWKATAPFRGTRGYHLNGIYCLFAPQKPFKNRLQQMVAGFLKAKEGGKYTLMVWVNTFLAETWEDETEVIESSGLMARREDYTTDALPDAIKVVSAGLDVQGNRIEVEVDGWSDGEESWGIEYRVFAGDTLKPKVWAEVDMYLQGTRWKTENGRELKIDAAALDTGFRPQQVYHFAKPRFGLRFWAIKGENKRGKPLISTMTRSNRMRCPVYRIGTDTAKDIIYGRLRLNEPGPGFMHYTRAESSHFDQEYFKMLTAERLHTKTIRGYPVRSYEKDPGARNEAIDLRVYSLAALAILQPDWILLTKNLERQQQRTQKVYTLDDKTGEKTMEKPATDEPKQPQTKPAMRPLMRPSGRKNFVNSWRKF